MRWPDIFFKPRKPKPLPEIVTVPPKAAAAEPVSTATEKTEAQRTEDARVEKEKTESLRALADSGSVKLSIRAEKESPIAETKPVESDASHAKTAALPSVLPRGGNVSLRQRAKLTDDARSTAKEEPALAQEPAKSEPESPKAAEPAEVKPAEMPKAEGGAVVPAAFTVPVETGSVIGKSEEKSTDKPALPEPEISKPVEVSVENPVADAPPARQDPPEGSSRDTMRVHLEPATTSAEPSRQIEPARSDTREKSEFVLANGERIYGHVLSETPQTIYLDHGTLGVLTLPRSQIAVKPIEVILINGDRVVGDLIAETPECLYIKHASLGMLTVPHGQRSTRVVEVILKDGDRILGEVLAETDNFTVIRSATLGTVAVQHEQVAMLNRKIEQMQLRALPPADKPALENKKD